MVINKLAVCQTCMGYEQSIRVSYQSLLAALETILFGFVFVLVELQRKGFLSALGVAGILMCIGIGAACEFRARNVDFWRRRIMELVEGTDLADDFIESKYGWIPLGKAGRVGEKYFGHWFERIVIPVLVVVWFWVVFTW